MAIPNYDGTRVLQVDMKEEIERRKKRAERFGMPVPVLKEEVRPCWRAPLALCCIVDKGAGPWPACAHLSHACVCTLILIKHLAPCAEHACCSALMLPADQAAVAAELGDRRIIPTAPLCAGGLEEKAAR